ncbi:MerR family transcriptional regulator [Modestobacter sp. Leaf380]|uniref:transcriptional regulator FtsR n=1 Tax=Modestobacter sp. Leaf380 TaxID=1736356 RepID=UPI0006F81DFF|nr:MerR family transcriptional regulator [Modestobacter sp. Leaf380]KQS65743.1 MerR family transcriptional regulator [Modestobacter sp. Leaf380]
MTAAPRPEPDADTQPRFTIGEVLASVRGEFPDVTISKIRYLEGEDLVHPQRTPSGYRKFSTSDVARLRFVLAAQRDQYLPLRVIKEHLDALDRGEPLPDGTTRVTGQPPVPASAPDPDPEPTPVGSGAEAAVDDVAAGEPMSPEDFGAAAGLDPVQLADCVQYGLLTPDAQGRHPVADLPIASAAGGLARHGIEARHLRVYRSGAEREAQLLEQVVAPGLRARSEEAHTRAAEQLRDLAALSAQLHTALLESRLRDVLGEPLAD